MINNPKKYPKPIQDKNLNKIIRKSIEKNPVKRYQTCNEVIEELDQLLIPNFEAILAEDFQAILDRNQFTKEDYEKLLKKVLSGKYNQTDFESFFKHWVKEKKIKEIKDETQIKRGETSNQLLLTPLSYSMMVIPLSSLISHPFFFMQKYHQLIVFLLLLLGISKVNLSLKKKHLSILIVISVLFFLSFDFLNLYLIDQLGISRKNIYLYFMSSSMFILYSVLILITFVVHKKISFKKISFSILSWFLAFLFICLFFIMLPQPQKYWALVTAFANFFGVYFSLKNFSDRSI